MRYLIFIVVGFLWTQGYAQSESSVLKFYDTKARKEKVLNKEFTVEVGDSTKMQYDPSFKISVWRGECHFKVNLSTAKYPMTTANKQLMVKNQKPRIRLSAKKMSYDMFAKNEGEYEWEIILNEKPDTNVFTYPIETKGLLFFYQDSAALFDGSMINPHVPDSVIGSYAVYHASKKNNFIRRDGSRQNYMTGKAFHLYRPKVWDKKGKDTVWCSLYIDAKAGRLSITVPQSFLNSAIYPVTVDPTFGKTARGGNFGGIGAGYNWSAQNNGNGDLYNYVASAGDTVTELHASLGLGSNTAQMAIYKQGINYPNDLIGNTDNFTGLGTDDSAASGHGQWHSKTGLSIGLSDGVEYCPALGVVVGGTINVDYDGGSSPSALNNDYVSPAGWNDPWDYDGDNNNTFSFYATYTEGGGAAASGQVMKVNIQ